MESWFDGYYRVESVSVDTYPKYDGLFPYSIQLSRVADGASPRIDSTLVGALRTNGNSVTTGRAVHIVPLDGVGYYAKGGVFGTYTDAVTGAVSRPSENGPGFGTAVGAISAVTNGFASFECAPGDYYDGTCLIRSGTTLRRVMGQRMKRLPTNWEIGNGIIKCTPASTGRLQFEMWNGSAWESAKTMDFSFTSASGTNGLAAWVDVSVQRNSPEAAAIRLIGSTSTSGTGALESRVFQVDIMVQRGKRHMVLRQTKFGGTTGVLAFYRDTAEAATAITGAIRATSNDANGNRYILAMAEAFTADLTQGSVRLTSNGLSNTVMFGYELDGSSAASNDTAANIVGEFYYPINERMVPRVR